MKALWRFRENDVVLNGSGIELLLDIGGPAKLKHLSHFGTVWAKPDPSQQMAGQQTILIVSLRRLS
jgi:hypothetical protein